MVEKRWRTACGTENEKASEDSLSYSVFSLLPNDSELAAAFVERKQRLVGKNVLNFFQFFLAALSIYFINFKLIGKLNYTSSDTSSPIRKGWSVRLWV